MRLPASTLALAGLLAALPRAPLAAEAATPVESSVVKVFSTKRNPDFARPWTKESPQEVTGSGVVIEGRRVLTNAHVVLYASVVQVQANQAGDKFSATVESIAPGIDLAVLKLEDESFFEGHPPLERASALPDVKDAVMAYGFPTGGASLSITKGIVSRIEFASYNYPVSGLRIQIDAAINPGNSGGPAVVGDKMIGLAFASLGRAQNIGYIIPCEEIELFLTDVADGRYDGKPAMFDELQTLENPALRRFLGLPKGVSGVVVHQPASADAAYPLKEWDVVSRIGDTPIDDEGMVTVGPRLRVRFQYLVQRAARKGKVPLTIVRAGKERAVELPVQAEWPLLVPELRGTYPAYFVYGPLVFSPASAQYAGGSGPFGAGGATGFFSSPLVTRRTEPPAFPGEELVLVASPLFPHKLSKGYSNPMGQVVKSVNGVPVKSLLHLVALLRDARDEYVRLDFSRRGGEAMVLSRAEVTAATEEILTDNGVRAQGSPDALAVWARR
jgi:S1-C subfamily serine protease